MLFSNKKQHIHDKLKERTLVKVNEIYLEIFDMYKYLGVLLDDHLTFISHINYLIGIISGKNYILRKIRPYLTTEIALLLVKTCILPYYDIGDIFYNSSQKQFLNKLQVLTNNSLRTVYMKARGEIGSIDKMHLDAKLLKLVDRRRLHLLKVSYEMNEIGCHSFLEREGDPGSAGNGSASDYNTGRMTIRPNTRSKLNIERIKCAAF